MARKRCFFQVSFPFFVFFPPQVIIFKGGLLWSSHARRSSAEAPLPQRLPHLHLGQTAALRQPHAGGCQAALGEDEEEEGGHRHTHQRQEEGQAEHRLVKAYIISYQQMENYYSNSLQTFLLWHVSHLLSLCKLESDNNNQYAYKVQNL